MSDDDNSDWDKRQWQAEQVARDAAIEKQREKERKSRERAARNSKHKLERLRRTLIESGDITDWENEFSESVTERLDKYGSAFHDLQKGRPGDALSFAQKKVISSMNRKIKDAKKAKREDNNAEDRPRRLGFQRRSSFKFKGKRKFTPRVRHIEDELCSGEETTSKIKNAAPFIPKFVPEAHSVEGKPKVRSKKPFLRIVKKEDD